MEEKSKEKEQALANNESLIESISDHCTSTPLEKPARKSKRDAMKDKKRAKLNDGKLTQSEDLDTDNVSNKNKEDEAGSVQSQESSLKFQKMPESIPESPVVMIPKLLNKPPYVALTNSNKIVGNFGHASAIFKRPVVQGAYFMEFLAKEDAKKDKATSYPSAIRVGICIHNFDIAYPLGCNQSIAYKSVDGSIIRQNESIGKAEPYSVGDVIGVCMRIQALHKHADSKEIDQGSSVEFYKNGKLMFEVKGLKQVFYSFGVSVYNYSQVEVITNLDGSFRISEAAHYFSCLHEKIPYKDLQASKLLKL